MCRYLILCLALFFYACSQERKTVWIVLDLNMPSGNAVQLSFDNPEDPEMTLQACNSHLENNLPVIMRYVQNELGYHGAEYVNAECVMSIGDPLIIQP